MSCIIASNFIDDQPMTTMMCCTLPLLKGDGKRGQLSADRDDAVPEFQPHHRLDRRGIII
jgi:hypothetical protein